LLKRLLPSLDELVDIVGAKGCNDKVIDTPWQRGEEARPLADWKNVAILLS